MMEVEAAIDRAASAVGLTSLKPLQREAIRAFASGNDVFVSLPTGYGKSFCYVTLPFVFDFMWLNRVVHISSHCTHDGAAHKV